MGIQGLLPALKAFTEPVEIKKYAGKRVGIDGYSWLHKGAYACSMELCESKSPNESRNGTLPVYVQYCMHRVNMLKYHNVTPVVVFDGGYLPQKASTETHRAKKRKLHLEEARSRLSTGNTAGAIESYQRAVEITPLMAYELIRVLKREFVEFIVAPYEADSQLAFLARKGTDDGGVDAVISEDSDLLACGCDVVIYKMDRFGNGEEIELQRVLNSVPVATDCLSFRRFTRHLFTGMCVLAGCDFLSSVPGIGLKKAHALVSKYRNLDRVIAVLRCDLRKRLPEGYAAEFKRAMALFFHARVYDSAEQKLCYLSPLTDEVSDAFGEDLDFLGPDLQRSTIIDIAEGRLDPTTLRPFQKDLSSSCHVRKNESQTVCSTGLLNFQKNGEETELLDFVTSNDAAALLPSPPSATSQTVFLTEFENFKAKQASKFTSTLHASGCARRVLPPVPDNNPFKLRTQQKHHPLKLLKRKQEDVTDKDGSSTLLLSSQKSLCSEHVAPVHQDAQTALKAQNTGITRFFHKN